jgi:hypothetical protein
MTEAVIYLRYEIGFGIKIGDHLIEWGTDRDVIRKMLQGTFEVVDHVYNDITSFRDFYSRLNGVEVLLSFNYGSDQTLVEIEIHKGVRLYIEEIFLEIGMDYFDAHDLVSQVSLVYRDVDEGETIYLELGMCIAAGCVMGSEEDDFTLSYVYLAKDISHLLG